MEQGGASEIGRHLVGHFAGLSFNFDTLIMTWLTMGIVIVLAVAATRRLSTIPSGWQNVLEIVITAVLEQVDGIMGSKGRKLAPLLITLFLFLLVGNWLGLVPGFSSPTKDLNTTLGLALMIVGMMHVLGVVNRGPVNYLKHFFQPYWPFVILNVIDELARPITLSCRLFGNILVGEILLIILGMLVPYLVPTIWLAFSVFVGAIQAFIFTMLSMVYLGNMLRDETH